MRGWDEMRSEGEHTQVSVISDLLIGGMYLGSSQLPSYWLPQSAETAQKMSAILETCGDWTEKRVREWTTRSYLKTINQLAIAISSYMFHFTFLAVPWSAASPCCSFWCCALAALRYVSGKVRQQNQNQWDELAEGAMRTRHTPEKTDTAHSN